MDKLAECGVCEKLESDANKLLTCLYCFSSAHFKCRNITGKAVNRVKSNMFFCTIRCSEMFKRINDMLSNKTSVINTVSNELKSIVSNIVVSQLGIMKSEVKSVSNAIESSQQFLSSKFDDILQEYQKLKQENETLKQHVNDLKISYSILEKSVNGMEGKFDKAELEELSNNAIFLGIPFSPNENVADLVCKTASHIGVPLKSDSLISANRFKPNNTSNLSGPIKVEFRSKQDKELVFSRKRRFGTVKSSDVIKNTNGKHKVTNVVIRDELTTLALELLKSLKDLQIKHKIKYVWPGRRGAILVKENDQSRITVIKTKNDLKEFVEKFTELS